MILVCVRNLGTHNLKSALWRVSCEMVYDVTAKRMDARCWSACNKTVANTSRAYGRQLLKMDVVLAVLDTCCSIPD